MLILDKYHVAGWRRALRRLVLILALLVGALSSPALAQFSGGGEGPAPAKQLSAAEQQTRCQSGDAAQCDDLGLRYLKGDGVAQDTKKAAVLFQRACNGGDAIGCFDIAESYRFGDGVAKDRKAAETLYLRGCDGNYAPACAELSRIYASDEGQAADYAKAGIYADRACKSNLQMGCALLGVIYARGAAGYPKDLRRAEQLLSNACFDNLDPKAPPRRAAVAACPALAEVTGEPACMRTTFPGGPSEDICFESAKAWSVKVIPAGTYEPPAAVASAPAVDPVAVSNNALNAGNAAYAKRDFATAAAQYAAGCDAGNASACGKLGEMFVKGEGVSANSARAAAPLAKACDGGVAVSCNSLGLLYERGNGVSLSKAKALALFARACAGGLRYACNSSRPSGQSVPSNSFQNQAYSSNLAQVNLDDKEISDKQNCISGDGDACASIAYALLRRNGENVKKSSLYFSDRGCMLKSANSCGYAGWYFSDPATSAYNPKKAEYYLNLGCSYGDRGSCSDLRQVEAEERFRISENERKHRVVDRRKSAMSCVSIERVGRTDYDTVDDPMSPDGFRLQRVTTSAGSIVKNSCGGAIEVTIDRSVTAKIEPERDDSFISVNFLNLPEGSKITSARWVVP